MPYKNAQFVNIHKNILNKYDLYESVETYIFNKIFVNIHYFFRSNSGQASAFGLGL